MEVIELVQLPLYQKDCHNRNRTFDDVDDGKAYESRNETTICHMNTNSSTHTENTSSKTTCISRRTPPVLLISVVTVPTIRVHERAIRQVLHQQNVNNWSLITKVKHN